MIDTAEMEEALALRLHQLAMARSDKGRCANRTKNAKCDGPPMTPHIYCKGCFVANGGYDRYSCYAVRR